MKKIIHTYITQSGLAHVSTGEVSTVRAMQEFCKAEVKKGRNTLVYYFHNKGTGNIHISHTYITYM